ncbi:AEC family transporter [Intestinibacter sp.]|uniref:AEC family transporter n=1 Tax=Intestinibacter sp. TaxID=1965304 RepID=UPI002A758BAB|nr:AEC family transporter [Intestinibacter sp.]MDY2734613.1 AEC family transporter [Intestinibacter sp.]MDY4576112.1 AEC family transporter [Intestinibacter sp.]
MDIQVIINQMVILFLVMIVGYIANKVKILDKELNQKLSSLVLNITSPALILYSVSEPVEGDLNTVLQIFLLSVAVYVVLPFIGIFFGRILRVAKEDRNLYQFMTIFSNIGFMGYPVIQAIFGKEALFFASICNLVFNILCYSYGVFLISGAGKVSFDYKKLINPGIIFSIIAVVIYLTKWQMPVIIAETSDLVGSITTPLAMMIIGSSLAEIPIKEVVSDIRIYIYTIIKQIIMPILFWWVLKFIVHDAMVLGVLVVLIAMPVGTIAIMFCNQFGGNTSLASKSIFITTLASVFTIPTLVYLLFA